MLWALVTLEHDNWVEVKRYDTDLENGPEEQKNDQNKVRIKDLEENMYYGAFSASYFKQLDL